MLARTEAAPLLEIQLELVANEIVWKPELTEGRVGKSVRDVISKWLKSFHEIGGKGGLVRVWEGQGASKATGDTVSGKDTGV